MGDGITLNEYQRQSMRTANPPDVNAPWIDRAFYMDGLGLGIAGEAGEVADLLKKVLHHGHEMDYGVLKKELGDVLWYIQAIAHQHGYTLSEVAEANIEKLQKRYPNGWTREDSINREDS